ncbi:hypothetical protein [Mesoplasma coleopterae]|uniref:Uncharacterized protein n=1 Tax=Mesoplasma coleopterae TaxID=324078 RepID=A0A2K8P2C8_9MOLU|nr:hypothetical protein [Mesoplasma coleopterae]ATZ20921.1 hypothetical protein MCOLE_v1c04070 [Mesoplasma coleopterae]AVN63101.1 hypothetical protein CG000_02195 [Mesoplasma coleopterae]
MIRNNKTFTTVEIRKNVVKINAYRVLEKNIISIFEQEIEAKNNSTFLTDNGIVKSSASSELKKEISAVIKSIIKDQADFKDNKIFMILPSSTYAFATRTYHINSSSTILINEEYINDLFKKTVKKEQQANNAFHLDVQFTKIKIDGIKYAHKNLKVEGNNIELTVSVRSIFKKVYDTHKNVIEKVEDSQNSFMTNLEALYNSIQRPGKDENDIVVVNWKEEHIEAGLFKNGSFIEYTSTNIGMNKVISKLSDEFGLSDEMSKHYLYNNINFDSSNILRTILLKFKNSVITKTLSGEQIQLIVKKYVKEAYKEIKESFVSKEKIDFVVTPIFNFGLIQEIPNGISLISNNKVSSDYINQVKIIGALKNNEHFESYGFINKIANKFITNQIKTKKQKITNAGLNMQFSFYDDFSGQNKASSQLYLKNDGIIIDKVEA